MAYSSLYEGVSGLNSQMKKMEVVGNNLANLNTAGFKKERVTFSDLFYNTISQASKSQGNIGGINSKQIGTGVDVASIDTIFTQGSKTSTGRELDFMVHGTDFFVVKSAVTDDLFLTRNGAFELDGEMQLLDSVGNAVIGRNIDPNTQVAGAAEEITIDDSAIDANATTSVTISDNIDLSSPEKFVESNSRMWELFSGGENFGEFGISDTSVQGSRTTYGSSYYGDTVRYTLDNTTLLTSADANSTLRYLAMDNTDHHTDLIAHESGGVGTGIDGVELADTTNYSAGDMVTVYQVTDTGGVIQEEMMIGEVVANNRLIFGNPGVAATLSTAFDSSKNNFFISKFNSTGTPQVSEGTLDLTTPTAPIVTVGDASDFSVNDVVTLNAIDTTGATGALIQQTVVISAIDVTGTEITIGETLSNNFTNGMDQITIYKNKQTGFEKGDKITTLDTTGATSLADAGEILAIGGGLIVLDSEASSSLSTDDDALSITNMTDSSDTIGSSGGVIYNDLLKSQLSMIDSKGNLIASYYRVESDPANYTQATATESDSTEITVGVGEFTTWFEFKNLLEETLKDTDLTNNSGSSSLSITIDSYGKITLGGTGEVEDFLIVANQETTGMRNMLNGLLYEGEIADTQALLNSEGTIKTANTDDLDPTLVRAVDSNTTTYWFESTGIEGYDYTETDPSTGYAEYAGMRLDEGVASSKGEIKVSMLNALGETQEATLLVVPRSANPSKNEFSTMGEFITLLETTLKQTRFSTIVENGILVSDSSVDVSLSDGRVVLETTNGSFNTLTITPQDADPTASATTLTDYENFGTVLGDLLYGVNGKKGVSNKIITPDALNKTIIYDSLGSEHTSEVFFIRDRTAELENIEWKVQTSVDPNVNTSVSSTEPTTSTYVDTFNSLIDLQSRSVMAFSKETGAILDDTNAQSDNRYETTAELEFSPLTDGDAVNADDLDITFDLENVTSYNGKTTLTSVDTDGNGFGTLLRLVSDQTFGLIKGHYSNGKTRDLAQLGLMSVTNPGGLDKIGMSNFRQTPNTNPSGNIQNIGDVFFLEEVLEGEDALTSTIGSSSLESSNVNLTTELTEMIVTQRSYSASGKVVTTSDQMYQEALSLVR